MKNDDTTRQRRHHTPCVTTKVPGWNRWQSPAIELCRITLKKNFKKELEALKSAPLFSVSFSLTPSLKRTAQTKGDVNGMWKKGFEVLVWGEGCEWNRLLWARKRERAKQNKGKRGSKNALSIFHLLCVAHLSARQQGSLVLTQPYWLIHITKPQLRMWHRVNQQASKHGKGRIY